MNVSPILTTALSFVDGEAGVLRLRGFSLEELVQHGVSYAAAVGLLFTGSLSEGDDVAARLLALSPPPIDSRPSGQEASALRRAMALIDDDGDAVAAAGVCGRLVGCLGAKPEQSGAYVERILRGVSTGAVDDDDVAALDRCFLVHLDHALNPGTLCCRVAASTGASLIACLSAGLCALEGPLHGGASSAVGRVLEQELQGPDDVDAWLAVQRAQRRRIPGFGHPIYRRGDPRAGLLCSLAQRAADRRGQRRFVDTATALETCMSARSDGKLLPNVDLYAACLYATLDVPVALHTPLFFAARVLGWAAHALEQRAGGRVISPEAGYDGPPARSF